MLCISHPHLASPISSSHYFVVFESAFSPLLVQGLLPHKHSCCSVCVCAVVSETCICAMLCLYLKLSQISCLSSPTRSPPTNLGRSVSRQDCAQVRTEISMREWPPPAPAAVARRLGICDLGPMLVSVHSIAGNGIVQHS